jgi:hypothetical protein
LRVGELFCVGMPLEWTRDWSLSPRLVKKWVERGPCVEDISSYFTCEHHSTNKYI